MTARAYEDVERYPTRVENGTVQVGDEPID